MIKECLLYYRIFSFKFLIRSLVVRFLRIKDTEVRLLNMAERMITGKVDLKVLSESKVKASISLHGVNSEIILRKNTSDFLVLNQVIFQNEYSPLNDLVLEHGYKENIKVIVDAGANIGLSALYFSSLFPNATVYAIEPSRGNFLILLENIEANDLKVVPLNNALLSSKGRVKSINTFRDRRDWSTQVVRSDSEGDTDAIALLDLIEDFDLDEIDILKMDIEGHEVELFGSEEFLTVLERIKFIAIEIHEEKADRIAIINILQAKGYKLLSKGETIFGYNEGRRNG